MSTTRSAESSRTVPVEAAGSRRRWPLWGAAAGVLGAVGHLVAQAPASVFEAQAQGQATELIEMLDRGLFHLGAVAGIFAVLCLLLFAAGWRRWSERMGGGTLAAQAVPLALAASAGAMLLGYGMMGAMSVYLPGGINAGQVPNEGLYVVWAFLDLAPFMAWWGVAASALFVSYISLVERRLPIWLGAVGVLGWLPPVGFLALTGLTGFPGLVGPVWFTATAVGLALTRSPSPRET